MWVHIQVNSRPYQEVEHEVGGGSSFGMARYIDLLANLLAQLKWW